MCLTPLEQIIFEIALFSAVKYRCILFMSLFLDVLAPSVLSPSCSRRPIGFHTKPCVHETNRPYLLPFPSLPVTYCRKFFEFRGSSSSFLPALSPIDNVLRRRKCTVETPFSPTSERPWRCLPTAWSGSHRQDGERSGSKRNEEKTATRTKNEGGKGCLRRRGFDEMRRQQDREGQRYPQPGVSLPSWTTETTSARRRHQARKRSDWRCRPGVDIAADNDRRLRLTGPLCSRRFTAGVAVTAAGGSAGAVGVVVVTRGGSGRRCRPRGRGPLLPRRVLSRF